MDGILNFVGGLSADFGNGYIFLLRLIAPVLMGVLLWRAGRPILSFRKEPEIWAILRLEDGTGLPVTHWENIIGRHPRSDLVINLPTISKNHAVLTRYDDGSWTITDTESTSGVRINGQQMDICALEPDDEIELGGVKMYLEPITEQQEQRLSQLRTKASSGAVSAVNLLMLTLFQAMCCLAFLLNGDPQYAGSILLGFSGICAAQWLLLLFYACIRRSGFEIETIAFLLCTMGMNVIAATVPQEAMKQLVALGLGLVVFFFVGWSLRDLERAKLIRYYATIAGIGFLILTLIFGTEIYGAKNWLVIAGFSIQPSELSKLCFVFVGASTMDRILRRRNLIGFIAYSVVLCGLLALMNDFGTALIFFIAFLSIAYMRSGSVGTIGLAITSLVFAGVIALKIAPHALRRFSIWRQIWLEPLDRGFQQTRCLMCLASGGFLGMGAGNGWMKHLFACDTDVVFATVGEEWGLFAAMMMVAAVCILALFCLRSASLGRSSFYTIGACTCASILLAQTILNVMGTIDLLPFTGVTFPFVSNGGSAMISAWGMLAFMKAADIRQDSSFAIRINRHRSREVDE